MKPFLSICAHIQEGQPLDPEEVKNALTKEQILQILVSTIDGYIARHCSSEVMTKA